MDARELTWRRLKIAASLAAVALVFGGVVNTNALAGFTGPYEMQNWSSSVIPGGTTSITPSSGPATSAEFGYTVNLGSPGGGVTYRTATFSATAAGTGYLTFDWTYDFYHAWFMVEADFYVFAESSSGTTLIHEIDFYNAMYTGPQTFSGSSTIWVEEGYDFGFIVGGSNFDSDSRLNGTLTISNFGIPVEIDIKPGSYPSSINLKKKGLTPVAIHTTDDFDATTVDPETVELEGVPAVQWEIYDCDEVPNPDYGDPLYPDAPEMIGDGDLDLVVYFDTEALAGVLLPGATEATLTGQTYGGLPIEGTGDVSIVVQGKP